MTAITETFTSTGAGSNELEATNNGNFSMSISGITTATIAIQRSLDGGSTWNTIESYTADAEKTGYEPIPGTLYRFNCTAYTAGTVVCVLEMSLGHE